MALEACGEDTSGSTGSVPILGGTADTKGAYLEMSASTGITANRVNLMIGQTTGSGGDTADFLVDIALGAMSSEVDLIDNILISVAGSSGERAIFGNCEVGVQIGSGTRVSTRIQAHNTLVTEYIGLLMTLSSNGPADGDGAPVTYGINTGTTSGVQIDPGGSANTKPATWTQIEASTSAELDHLLVCIGNEVNTARAGANWLVDIATGAASSEVDLIPDFMMAMGTVHDVFMGFPANWNVGTVASSTRLSARAQCNITDATDRTFEIGLIAQNVAAVAGGGGTVAFWGGF